MEIQVVSKSSSLGDAQELNAIRILGHQLPASYRKFSAAFEYGRLGGLVIIYSGDPIHPDSVIIQGGRVKSFIDEAISEDYFEFRPASDERRIGNLYPFAASENGEYFAWDLNSGEEGEYLIYCIGARMAGLRYAARSLDELFDKLCGDSIRGVMGPGYKPLPRTFEGL